MVPVQITLVTLGIALEKSHATIPPSECFQMAKMETVEFRVGGEKRMGRGGLFKEE